MPHQSLSFWFHHPNSNCSPVQTMKLLSMQLYLFPSCFLPLRLNCLPQHPVTGHSSLWWQTKHLRGSEQRKPSVLHTRPASSFTNGLGFVFRTGTRSHTARVWTRPN
jgi:hypothetical protein